MRKIFLLSQIVLGLMCFSSFAQTDASDHSLSKKVIQFIIKPSATDHTIKVADSPHLVMYHPDMKQGKLLLFMPGTGGLAKNGPDDFFATAMQLGYRVISLSYIDTPAVWTTCTPEVLADDVDCAEEFRIKRIFGTNTTPLISDEPQDAIMNRFSKLLIYLIDYDKPGHWGVYLENGVPKWDQIAVAGHSQGGAMASFIAKQILVDRVISFSGGSDHSSKNKLAGWYFKKSVTPPERWYGVYNIAEPTAAAIAATYRAMAIPDNHIYPFKLDVRRGKQPHAEVIENAAYKQQWIELLGVGN